MNDDGSFPVDGPSADAAAVQDEKANILIVDDLREKLLVFATVLDELGQNLVFVQSGSEALRQILQREFAVILLDVNMPDMDGFEAATLIRKYKRSAHTPIIFITSYADEMQSARGYSLGAVDYIQSPVVPEVLRSKVKVFVSLYAMQRQVMRQADAIAAMAAAQAARRAAEQNNRRSAFLADASRVLSGSLHVTTGMNQLAELVVPQLASMAVLLLVDPELEVSDVVVAASVVGEPRPALDKVPANGLDPAIRGVLQRAVDSNTRLALATDDLTRLTAGSLLGAGVEGPLAGLHTRELRSAVAVPLAAGERVIGALLAATPVDAAAEHAPDWTLLEDLASRAGTAFENARLYRSLQSEIVERRTAQEQMQQSNQRKDEFLAMLSHELRNPLAPIRAALEVMRRLAPPDPKFNRASDIMNRQLTQLTRLIEELLDVARISQGKIVLTQEPANLNQVIAQSIETTQPFIDSRGQTLRVAVSEQPVWVNADSARLAQVIANLLHNASKYSNEGTVIELISQADAAEVLVSVRDHGIGIDAELLPRIFDLFAQGARGLDRAQGGLGVGLTLAQRLVEMHGGRIQAFSLGADRGSEFKIWLPCVSPAVSGATGRMVADAPPVTHSHRVLLVDDNRDAALTMAMMFEMGGHQVRTASSGEEALACVASYRPEVIVLDIGLPRIDGYEVARRMGVMPETESALFVALTGYGQKADREAALEAGFDHHFVKPADPNNLLACIRDWSHTNANRFGQGLPSA